jgi:S1-C subfamily serine protease
VPQIEKKEASRNGTEPQRRGFNQPKIALNCRKKPLAHFMELLESMTKKSADKSFVVAYLAQIERMAQVLGGIPVWEVVPDSAAEAAGLLFGDIVLSVNADPTPTFAAFLAAGETHLAHLEFEVFRQGQVLLLNAGTTADA